MKLIIAGSRPKTLDITNGLMDAICRNFNLNKKTVERVVSGKAEGIDHRGAYWAVSKGIPVKPFPADWDKYDKAAGPIRNKEMAKYADELLLVWDGKSKGSLNMKTEMLKLNKPVHEVIMRSHNATN